MEGLVEGEEEVVVVGWEAQFERRQSHPDRCLDPMDQHSSLRGSSQAVCRP